MSKNRPQQTGVEDLLAKDADVSTFQFEEFRMNLEVSIQRLEQRARIVRRASLWGMGIFITCVVSVIPMEVFELWKYEWVPPLWSGCGTIAMLVTGVLTAIYSYRYRPALKQARSNLQLETIAYLQQQVEELSHKLDGL